MGSTEEALITKVHGHGARGDPSERPFDRKTGVGRLSEKPGDYSDAASRGHKTILLATEITGAMSRALPQLLRAASKSIGLPGVSDKTIYGTGRSCPRGFYLHHLTAISAAIAHADALTLLNHASSLNFQLTTCDFPAIAPAGPPGGRRA